MSKGKQPSGLTGSQLRAARALLGMSAQALAERSKVSLRTIRRAEADNGMVSMTDANASRLIEVLTARGVIFGGDPNGPSVGLRAKPEPIYGD